MNQKKPLIIAACCGVLALALSLVYFHVKENRIAAGERFVEVLAVNRDLPPQTFLDPDMFEVKKVPVKYVQPGAITDPREVEGKVTIASLLKGEYLLGSKLVAGGASGGLSSKIPEGKRAVSIEMEDYESAGGMIRPDDYVDVLVTFDYGDQDQSDKYTYPLFQNVSVLAVDASVYSLKYPSGTAIIRDDGKEMFSSLAKRPEIGSGKKVVTLALSPEDAEKIVYASEAGKISLLLRAPTDRTLIENPRPVNIEALTEKAGLIRNNFKEYRGR